MNALMQTDFRAAQNDYRLVLGFKDQPDRIYLVRGKKRYWIASGEVFFRCGFSAADLVHATKGQQKLPEGPPLTTARRAMAARFLRGAGLEIGALHNASLVPDEAEVSYVDYITQEEALRRYPECDTVVPVHILDDGEILRSVAPESQDFIVANHFLEHTENPLGTLRVHASKLRQGGILFYTLPDKRYTFDKERPITPFSHLLHDDSSGPEVSRVGHYLEFVELVDGLTDPKAMAAHAKVLMDMDNRIHFHVWDADATKYMFEQACKYLDNSLEILAFVSDGDETVTVLRRAQ